VRVEIPVADESLDLDSLASRFRFTTFNLGTPRNWAINICWRNDGRLVVASDSGLFLIDPAMGELSRPQFSDSIGRRLNCLPLYCLIKDSQGNCWVGTGAGEGLFRIDWEANKVWHYRHKQENGLSPRSEKIYDLAEDRDGNIWIGSEEGVYLFSPSTGHYLPYLTLDAALSRPSAVTLISGDRTGTLWIALASGGVHWLSPKAQRFPRYSIRDGTGSSPVSFNTVERDQNGNCWLFSSQGILYQIDISTLKILKTIDVLRGKEPTFGVSASFIDARGTYWYGSYGLGLFRIDFTNGKIRNYSSEADEINLYFDRDKVEKILTNLLANAFKFTPDGGRIEVVVTPTEIIPGRRGDPGDRQDVNSHLHNKGERPFAPENKWVVITVADSGVGIPEDQLTHIFDRFYQVDGSSTRQQGGTGIGLALVKELIEMHHGSISATSQPGVGSQFTVRVPIGREHLKPDEIVERTEEEYHYQSRRRWLVKRWPFQRLRLRLVETAAKRSFWWGR
jgi:ligand-binding sensor domain-containing protein